MERHKLFRRKSISELIAHSEKPGSTLKKSLGAFDLTMLGVGAVVGAGIFVLPGQVASEITGPAIIISFIIAGIACALAALCYSEFASSVPVTGSAYTYSYAVFGELIAWILGWALLLEYGLASASVASGWSSYLQGLLAGFNIHLPHALSGAFNPAKGTFIDLPAVLIVLFIAFLLTWGIRESAKVNAVMVLVKIAVVVLFIVVGIWYVKPVNWTPFAPFGFHGIVTGAATVFFAYIGFDAVSTAAEEVKNPKRNMPIGIIASLLICTLLYIILSSVLTGIVPYTKLFHVGNPVAFGLEFIHQDWVAGFLSLGAIVGMTTVILVMTYGGTRLVYAMSRDGLLPKGLSKVNKKTKTPVVNTWVFCIIIAFFGGFISLDKLAEMVNIGTLFAFTMVSLGIFFLRHMKEKPKSAFKVPLYPILPAASFVLCLYLIFNLQWITWLSFGIWLVIGLIIYGFYGSRNSTLRNEK
ncbi:amino acid permease [Bacillus sp. APMAM]|nr:amino acid permease [Bacillus sp. APMAM]RTZ56998.1 amino acid permease [Bacillus sp. SAJ1]